jgi:hypothetical protein
MTTRANARILLCGMTLAGAIPLAGCGSSTPETQTTTTTEQTGATPPPAAPMQAPLLAPGTPGTITTQTTHTQTNQ